MLLMTLRSVKNTIKTLVSKFNVLIYLNQYII